MLSLLRNCVVALTQGGGGAESISESGIRTVSISHLLYALPSLYSLYLLQWAFPRRSTYTRCSTKDKDQLISPLMFDLNAYLSRGTGNKIPSTAFVIATVGKFILYFFPPFPSQFQTSHKFERGNCFVYDTNRLNLVPPVLDAFDSWMNRRKRKKYSNESIPTLTFVHNFFFSWWTE